MQTKLKTDSNTDERSQIGWMTFDILAFPMATTESALHKLACGEVQPTVMTQEESYSTDIPWNMIYRFRKKLESFKIR